MGYAQLTHGERHQIAAPLKAEHDQTEIAMILGRKKPTISRKIRRNTGLRGYRPRQAQLLMEQRRQTKAIPRISNIAWSHVDTLLKEDRSPEQISLWPKAEHSISISHEWVYQYILQDKAYGGSLYRHLRCQKKRRGQLIDRISIDGRPEDVDQRSRIGDWELDTIIGKSHKQAIASLTERKTAESVANAIIKLLTPFSDHVLTMTSDHVKEFVEHK